MLRRPPRATRFPYTTLSRSALGSGGERQEGSADDAGLVRELGPHHGRDRPVAAALDPLLRRRSSRQQQEIPGLHRAAARSEEHTSELQSRQYLVCRLLLEKK